MDTDIDLTPPQQTGTQAPVDPQTAVRYGSNLAWCTAQFSAVRDAEGRPHAVNRTCNHCNAVVVSMPSRPGTLEQRPRPEHLSGSDAPAMHKTLPKAAV